MSAAYNINMIVHGPSKHGKSTLGDSTPGPRVVIDAEAGSRFTPSDKVIWDPTTQAPPALTDPNQTALVLARSYRDVLKTYEWLNSGQHPFKSAVVDSISEIQQRAVDEIVGTNQMQTQDWGNLLRMVADLVRKIRDLTVHPTNPLEAVVVIAMTALGEGDVWRPLVQGQLKQRLPYYFDICAYYAVVPLPEGGSTRRLFVGPTPGFETGERVGGRLGPYLDDPTVAQMLRVVRGEEKSPTLLMMEAALAAAQAPTAGAPATAPTT